VKWIIKNPAPFDGRMKKWGDYHFGRSLSKWLQRSGHTVDTHYYGQWGCQAEADVTLVLRGRHRRHGRTSGLRVMWIISHPDDVTLEECAGFDLVFTASAQHAEWLDSRLDAPVYPLLQCVDSENFKPAQPKTGSARSNFVFVGNTRDTRRESVLWAVEAGLPIKVWGRGWESWIEKRFIVADYLPNQNLAALYSRAKVTFNDHWPDMSKWGFVNNRIFDALACGLPVLSDHHKAIEDLFGEAVLYFNDQREFSGCIDKLLLQYPLCLEKAQAAIEGVRKKHSFESRAKDLVRIVRERADS